MITGHGNDIYDFEGKIKADFSSNIAYCNASARIIEHLKTKLDSIIHYPDPNASRLKERIAHHHGLNTENILITNGSAEAFYLLAHCFVEKKTLIPYPSFAEYEDACRLFKHKLHFVAIEKLKSEDIEGVETLWIGNPNNPDGTHTAAETIAGWCINFPKTVFIIDTAYATLSPTCDDVTLLHHQYANLITVHSLTKAFAIAGLRLGYIVADAHVIAALDALRVPWTVNSPAQEAGHFIMRHYAELHPNAGMMCEQSLQLQQALSEIEELEVKWSACHYFLVKTRKGTAAQLKMFLIDNHGILIRNADNFRGLTPRHFRLAVQTDDKNSALIDALKNYFAQ